VALRRVAEPKPAAERRRARLYFQPHRPRPTARSQGQWQQSRI
jgi:hypothetical protein